MKVASGQPAWTTIRGRRKASCVSDAMPAHQKNQFAVCPIDEENGVAARAFHNIECPHRPSDMPNAVFGKRASLGGSCRDILPNLTSL